MADCDEAASVASLILALRTFSTAQLESFNEHLAQVLFDIDGQSYADSAGDSGQSDDGFLYVRCYVVAQGQVHYEQVKAAPTRMATSKDQWCESLLYVAQSAWAANTGRDPAEWPFEPSVSYESGSNGDLWP